MKAKRFLALLMVTLMVVSVLGSAGAWADAAPASVDFEDGSMSFVSVYSGMANADACALEVVDYNGSKALQITNGSGKVPYVAFDVASLLGDKAGDVASIDMTMGIVNPDGEFYACSGNVMLWVDGALSAEKHGWSVYMETKNPKTANVALDPAKGEVFSAEQPLMVVTLEVDNGATAGAANATLYIDDIAFKDADGNVLEADTAAAFTAPDGFGGTKDMSNLQYLGADAVELEGMAGKAADGWAQDGVDMTEDFLAALVPGAVIEIEYSSETGDMWIVMPDATVGWSRVEQQTAATNLSKNICQITYEQIAAVCGDDVASWGARLQCEASGAWEVYSVKVGQPTGLKNLAGKTEIPDMAGKAADAWAQDGVELTEEQLALLVPGSVIEISYASETGDMWIVMPDAAAGWSRVGDQAPVCNGSVAQVTYEQIAEVCGDDPTTWGTRLQCESSGAWEVYGVSICSGAFKNVTGNVEIPEMAGKAADAWTQDGVELTEEQLALLVPGSVITIQYASDTGDMWIVMPDAAAGWSRVGDQAPVCDGNMAQVTYEQIAAVCGDDVSAWGTRLQCEASGAWEVFSVSIGTAAE